MVHENGLQTNLSQEGVVNSSSLEDVQLNEPIENRAQSIQSLHSSIETLTPTPDADAVPSYDELQQRLDEYNRHIAQMNEQKNQLQRMHSDAKRHLMLLEQYQRECAERNLSFDDKTKNGGEHGGEHGGQPPDYDSVDEVQSDMAILAQRVQNISRIVDNQKKLVNQLPDEATEDLRANQADLERKLKDLKRNGNDLHLLAAELDTMNTAVATTTATKIEEPSTPTTPTTAAAENGMRVVPIRVTAASARNQSPAKSIDENDTPAAAPPPGTLKSIDQKEAEIEIMRAQLQRLKLMMGTIETMESRTQPHMQLDALIDRDRTPTPASAAAAGSNRARNLRILDNVSSDLRAESERNEVAQERIMSLQDHISRCSKQAAAAIQLGDDALKRHSATPTPTPASLRSQRSITPDAADASSSSQTASELEREYRAKKQQFEEICRKMNANDNNEQQQQQQTAPAATTTKNCQNAPTKTELVNSSSSSSLAEHVTATAAAQLDTAAAPATPAAAALSGGGGAANVHHISDGLSFDASSLGGGSTLNSFSLPAALNLNANNNNGGGISWPPGTSSWSLPNFRSPLISMPQNIQLPNFVPQSPLSMPFNAATSAATTNGLPPTAAGATSGWENSTLVQHCLQQQQIFGQALNQLYTIIWQQQREIEHLHRGIVVLQERLLRLSDDVPLSMPAELGLDMNFRAESVPPTFNMSLGGGGVSGAGGIPLPPYLNMTNNGLDMNRAQSEQPQPLQHQHAPHNQQHYHHLQQQQQQQQQRQLNMNNLGATSVGVNGAGIFSSELHHHHQQQQQQQQTTQATASSVIGGGGGSTRIYATLNNANVSGPQQHQSYRQQSLDTSTKTSQQHQQEVSGGIGAAPPIFMHHHNNAIHQNNANLRRANLRSNIAAAAAAADANNSTLNNQVPPGNRTNNYWDNFRSYSRQNLFSTNLNKSNHVGNQQQQQNLLRRRCQTTPVGANFNFELSVENDDDGGGGGGGGGDEAINCRQNVDDDYVAEDLSMRTLLRQQQQQQHFLPQQRQQQQQLNQRRLRLNQQFHNEQQRRCLDMDNANINIVGGGCFCSNIDCSNSSKNIVSHNCLKNFQQLRQQQQQQQQQRQQRQRQHASNNSLPLDAFITNSLHANAASGGDVDDGDDEAVEISYPSTAQNFYLMNVAEQQQQQQPSTLLAVNDLDMHFTSEMYGPNYEQQHHQQQRQQQQQLRQQQQQQLQQHAAAAMLLHHNNNVNFDNSPLNRQQHNKMPPKFQYRKGQCFGLNHFGGDAGADSGGNDGDDEMLLLNNHNHNHNNNSNLHYRRFVGEIAGYEALPTPPPPPPPPPPRQSAAVKRELDTTRLYGNGSAAATSYFNRYPNAEFEASPQTPPTAAAAAVAPTQPARLLHSCGRNLSLLPIYAYEFECESQAEAEAAATIDVDKFGHSNLLENFHKILNDGSSSSSGVGGGENAGTQAQKNLENFVNEASGQAQQSEQPEKLTNSDEQLNLSSTTTTTTTSSSLKIKNNKNSGGDNASSSFELANDDVVEFEVDVVDAAAAAKEEEGACSLAAQLEKAAPTDN